MRDQCTSVAPRRCHYNGELDADQRAAAYADTPSTLRGQTNEVVAQHGLSMAVLSYKREHRVTVNSHLLKKTFAQHELRKSVLSTFTVCTPGSVVNELNTAALRPHLLTRQARRQI